MYISVCRACNHFLVAKRPTGTVSPCQECGGALRAATMAEVDTFGQGMAAHTRRKLTVGAAVSGAGEGTGVTLLDAGALNGERLEVKGGSVPPKTEDTEDAVWLMCALDLLPAAIALLPRDERQVVIGYYFDQRSVAELAETYGLEQHGASALIRSALAYLRDSLR